MMPRPRLTSVLNSDSWWNVERKWMRMMTAISGASTDKSL